MVERGSGVIIALNSGSSHGSPLMGSTGPADAALDIFVRNLAQEIGPRGVRVAGIWTAGVPETLSPEKLGLVNAGLELDEAAFQGILDHLDGLRMLRRSPSLAQVADAAVFLASDAAGAITGTFLNVTSGIFAS
jgi:enoyl-[acyl-carrier-protein] reductase (NADH)